MIAVSVWMTALPSHAVGSVVNYGDPSLMRDQAWYRGYDLTGYVAGIAAMSPADLGKAFTLKPPGGAWEGPYLAVDVSERGGFCANAGWRGEVAEVDREVLARWTSECCILRGVQIKRWGSSDVENPPVYRDVINWRFLREGEYEPSPRPFRTPKQEEVIADRPFYAPLGDRRR